MKKLKIFGYGFFVTGLVAFGYIKYHHMNVNDTGLAVLSWIKSVKGNAVDITTLGTTASPTMTHEVWTALLQKHVSESGQVNYKGFISDTVLLQQYLDKITKYSPGKNWTKEEQLAYWINAYNAFTVKLIVDNYPVKSIKDISNGLSMINSPWDISFFKIGDIDFDLNTIEHDILRKKFDEPRIHFAINCASFSCPKLRNEAFTAVKLERQLNEQATDFINDATKNMIAENEIRLSKIFDWFKSDFTKSVDLLTYIEQYQPTIDKTLKVNYMDYDWSLNE